MDSAKAIDNVRNCGQNVTGSMCTMVHIERNLSPIGDTERNISTVVENVNNCLQNASGYGVNNNNINSIPYASVIIPASRLMNRIGCPACSIGVKKSEKVSRAYVFIHNGRRRTGLAVTREFLLVFSNIGGVFHRNSDKKSEV